MTLTGGGTEAGLDTYPLYKTVKVATDNDAPMGAMVAIFITADQPTTPVTIEPTLSVDLVLRY